MAKTKEKVTDAAGSVKPLVERALTDEQLRDDVQRAFATARKVYDELVGSKDVGKAASKVAGDRKLQRDLRTAVEDLRDAAQRLQGKDRKQHGGGGKRLFVAALALGALFNPVTGPETRRWLKELVTGGGEFGGDFGSDGS